MVCGYTRDVEHAGALGLLGLAHGNASHRAAIVESGVASHVRQLLRHENAPLAETAAHLVRLPVALPDSEPARAAFERSIPELVAILRRSSAAAAEHAAAALASLPDGSDARCNQVVADGCLPPLVAWLSPNSEAAALQAAAAIARIVRGAGGVKDRKRQGVAAGAAEGRWHVSRAQDSSQRRSEGPSEKGLAM